MYLTCVFQNLTNIILYIYEISDVGAVFSFLFHLGVIVCILFTKTIFLHCYFLQSVFNDIRDAVNFFLFLCALGAESSKKVILVWYFRYIYLILALSFGIPAVMFITFAVISFIITLGTFIFIEGSLLAFGLLCKLACTATLMSVLSVPALTLWAISKVGIKFGHLIRKFNPNFKHWNSYCTFN